MAERYFGEVTERRNSRIFRPPFSSVSAMASSMAVRPIEETAKMRRKETNRKMIIENQNKVVMTQKQ